MPSSCCFGATTSSGDDEDELASSPISSPHRSSLLVLGSLLVLAAAGSIGAPGCVVEADAMGPATSSLEATDAPRNGEDGPIVPDCEGNALPSCDEGWTGPSCDIACDPDAPGCRARVYCHSGGRRAGLALSRAHLFAIAPDLPPPELRDALEGWIAAHESDLGLDDGLTQELLQIEPADGGAVEQGQLTLHRFRQFYAASEAHPRIPVMGEGALLSLQADPAGAVALTGTVIDPRVPYAHAWRQAPASRAEQSIRHHVSARTGVPEADIGVDALQLVALPWIEEVGWYGVPTAGSMSMGRVIVSADPHAPGVLELLMDDDGKAYALGDVESITVHTQDVLQNPWEEPIVESVETTLANGAPLLGSKVKGSNEIQLGTEEVVVIDMHGNTFGTLYDGMSWDFERYTEMGTQFTVGEPEEQFRAQRLYHLVKSGYAVVDRVAMGQWDSAIWLDDPTQQSDFAPGTYRPRTIVGYNHSSTSNAGQASWLRPTIHTSVLADLPEVVQRPSQDLQHEVIATINAPLGLIDADTLFHEVGHNLDLFLAPGYPDNYAPPSCPGCGSCTEDTSDEANPLTETIAQMLGMWQLVSVFPDMSHDTCDLMSHLKGGATNNQQNVHSPGCMSSSSALSLFLRDDDPACPDPSLCDKPSNDETDPSMGAPHWCDATEGYNTYSIFQVWWNVLHGLYCEPPDLMGVDCTLQEVIWPPGCDQPGAETVCATPNEVAGLPLLYAIRSNPTSYEQLFDDMAKFISCNYGLQAYEDFNQALCDHQIRACDEPAPIICEQCGNGIREGTEQCDGHDVSVDELGQVATCTSLGYEDGALACQGPMDAQPCSYDFSLCTLVDPTGTGADNDNDTSTSGTTSGASDQTDTDGYDPGGVDGGDGCSCTTGGGRRGILPMSLVLLLAVRRRRTTTRALGGSLLTALGATACMGNATMAVASETDTDREPTSSSTDPVFAGTDSTSADETSDTPTGWPEDWYGDYYLEPAIAVGVEYPGEVVNYFGYENIRLDDGVIAINRFDHSLDGHQVEWAFATMLDGDALRVLPPGGTWETWHPGAGDVLVRAGADCDELTLEIHDRPEPYDTVSSARLLPGSLCPVDPYDDTIANDTWMVDLCLDSISSCSEG